MATMPIRFIRLPPCAKRFSYHKESPLRKRFRYYKELALEKKQQQGHLDHPVKTGEFDIWEDEQVRENTFPIE